jgi:hypothetical protein
VRPRRPATRPTPHEALSLATIAAIVVHAGALLGDGYLRPSLDDVTIPFVSDYERVWTTTGIVAGWTLIVLGLSYHARGRIGVAAGGRCTVSPRSRGCSGTCTASWRAPTRPPLGS